MTKAGLAQKVKIICVCATILLFVLAVIITCQYVKIGRLSSQSAMLDRKINELSITKSKLEEGIEIRSSDAYVEQQARENLGMIKDGEDVIIIK